MLRPLPLTCLLASAILLTTGCTYSSYNPPPVAFSGSSEAATQTVVAATLDSPAPQGKNVLWCATFPLAWAELTKVIGPLDMPAARDIVQRLNAAKPPTDSLPEDVYAAGGLIADGIVEKIHADMAERFPTVEVGLPPVGADIIAVAYAYLQASVKFHKAYFDREGGDEFVDSAGRRTRVSSFGLYKERDSSTNNALARQIDVLYAREGEHFLHPKEFILDLDKTSQPSQLILACIEPRETLAETWQDVLTKMDTWTATEEEREFGFHDTLVVPNVHFQLQHHFDELETTELLRTSQTIEFRLDRSGAALASKAWLCMMSAGRCFSFTKPFLIALRQRGARQPYFAMWVDNAELLCKQPNP